MGLPHGMLCTGRALAEGASGAGLWMLTVWKYRRAGSHLRADAKDTEMREQEDGVGHGTLQAQKSPCFRRRGWKTGSRNCSTDFFFPGGLIQCLPM